MSWMWIGIGVIVAAILVVLVSDIRLRIRLSRMEGDDHLSFDVRGLYGLLRYRYVIPVIYWKGGKGIGVKTEKINRNEGNMLKDHSTTITKDSIEQFYKRTRELLRYTVQLLEWTKSVLAKTVCTEMSWDTRIGLDDAPETAITTGAVWGLKTSMLAYLFRYIRLEAKPKISVQPQFNRMHFSTEAVCVIKLKAGYALYAIMVLIIRILRVKGGLKTWRKVFFKPS